MSDESFDVIEKHLGSVHPPGPPRALRAAVLADVRRELRASRWDRRLARIAGLLLVLGVLLNVACELYRARSNSISGPRFVRSGTQDSLLDTAIVIAEVTDVATGSRVARQMAVMSGRELSADEAAAIDAAIERAAARLSINGNKG